MRQASAQTSAGSVVAEACLFLFSEFSSKGNLHWDKDIGKICYVSSWTDDAEESILMWNMYTSLKSGIRIKMEAIPFEDRPDNVDVIQRMVPSSLELEVLNKNPKSLIPVDEQMINGIFVFPNKVQDILKKIVYTRDKSKLYPHLVSYINGSMHINLDLVGTHKNEKWKFQSEWRYLFFIVAHELINDPENQLNDMRATILKLFGYLKLHSSCA